MFWIACVVVAASTLLIKLGAMSVTVSVMSVALKVSGKSLGSGFQDVISKGWPIV